MSIYTREFSSIVMIAGVVVVLALGGLLYTIGANKDTEAQMKDDAMIADKPHTNDVMEESEKGDTMMQKEGVGEEGVMMEKTEDTMMKDDGAMMKQTYTGAVLAGAASPLIDFNKADYDAAIRSGKPVFLYFYANWCPTCKAEQPILMKAFNELKSEGVVGFRVNYKDNQTDADEEALAKQYGVAYQHTKVIIVGGDAVALKSPESWDATRYAKELGGLTQ